MDAPSSDQARVNECESDICLPSLSIYYALCVHKLTLSLGNFKTSDTATTPQLTYVHEMLTAIANSKGFQDIAQNPLQQEWGNFPFAN